MKQLIFDYYIMTVYELSLFILWYNETDSQSKSKYLQCQTTHETLTFIYI